MKTFTMTEEEYREGSENNDGFCVICGADAYDVEPDARGYLCDECDEQGVYGLEELLMMGMINFVGEEE